MKHLIADKLNFLMKATATRNNVLSRALAFDASHISRIRNGERGLPSHREFILPAAGFFRPGCPHGFPEAGPGRTALPRQALAGIGGSCHAFNCPVAGGRQTDRSR